MIDQDDNELKLTKQQKKIINASTEIAANSPGNSDMAFTHSIFCRVGLPRTKTDGRDFMRKSGGAG
mgnify:FL=1